MRVSKGSYCSAINCSNNKGRNPELHFFTFPKDPERCKKWVINSRREDLLTKNVKYLNENCRLCLEHFENSQFMNSNKNSLIKTAVPTVFSISNTPKLLAGKRKPPALRNTTSEPKKPRLKVVECKGRKRSTGDLSEEAAKNKTDEPSGSSDISDNLISLENGLQDSELVYSTQVDGQPSQTRIDDWTLKEEQEKISEHGDGIQHESLLGGQDSGEDYKMASLHESYHNDVTGTKRRKVTGLEDSISLDSYQECKDQKQILKRILDKVDDLDNPIFSFFRSMAQTVAQFPPHIIAETRVRVCQLIGEMEVKASQEQVLKSSQGYFHQDSPSQASQSKTSKRTINETTQVETTIPTAIPPQSSSSYSDKTQIFIKSELILESDDE